MKEEKTFGEKKEKDLSKTKSLKIKRRGWGTKEKHGYTGF